MDTDYSSTHIYGVLVPDGNSVFTFNANCGRTNPHYHEPAGWTRRALFFSEIAWRKRNYPWCGEALVGICVIYTNQSPPPWGIINLQEKKNGRLDLEERLMVLYMCVSLKKKSNLWFTGSGKCGLDGRIRTDQGLPRSMMRCLENDSLHDEDVPSIHDDQNQTLPPERETEGKKTKPSL